MMTDLQAKDMRDKPWGDIDRSIADKNAAAAADKLVAAK